MHLTALQHKGVRSDPGHQPRRDRRRKVSGFYGDIAWGKSLSTGVVEDISRGGFRMTDLPVAQDRAGHHFCRVVLSGQGRYYRLLVTPCWEKATAEGGRVEVGFKILDSSWDWLELTRN